MAWGAPSGRRFSAVVISAAFVVAMLVASCGPKPEANAAEFCAVLSDSFGLYVDNPVTQMGYRIGKVTSIEAHDTEVTVGFTIDQQRAIPEDVRAVVRSPSILADRALELVGDYDGGPQLKQGACIPPDRTFTPLSISEVIESADGFVNAISPDGSTNLQDTLSGIDQAVQGNGQGLNDLVTRSLRPKRPRVVRNQSPFYRDPFWGPASPWGYYDPFWYSPRRVIVVRGHHHHRPPPKKGK